MDNSIAVDHAERPTRVRIWIIAWAMLLAVLLYLDRFCLSIAELYIQQDLGLTDVQVGWMLSAFFWTYALAQVPSGWLTDRHGARFMMTFYVLAWSAFTGLTGLATGFVGLLLLRFGFGMAQAGAYPTSAVLLSHWAPVTSRGMASSVVSLGGRVGGAVAPILTAVLIVMFVPLSQSSRFAPRDLLDVSRLAERFAEDLAKEAPDEPERADATRPVTVWVWSQLTEGVRVPLASLAKTPIAEAWLLPSPGEGAADEPEGAAGTSPLEVGQALDAERLTAELNAILEDPGLGDLPGIDGSRLPREGQRLLAKESAERTQAERERLHRLILESLDRRAFRQLYVNGWRPVMLTYGLLGLPLAVGFWFLFRNHPTQHPWCNSAERAWILRGKPKLDESARPTLEPVPIGALVTNRSMWLNSISQCGTNVGWVFLVTWLPRYLENRHGVPVDQRAVMTFVPVAVGFAGLLLGGSLTDRLTRLVGTRWGRALPIGGSRLLATGAYLLCLLDPSPWMAVALFSVVAFATDLGIGGTWAFVQDVGGRHVGSVLGWGNMWGNLGAAAATPLLIWIVGPSQNWEAAFLTCSAAFLIAGLAGLGIDATKPLKS